MEHQYTLTCALMRHEYASVQTSPVAAFILHRFKFIHGLPIMKYTKSIAAFFPVVVLATALGCASTATQESTGEYVDDAVITTKAKTAIFNEPTLKSAEINVETFKGVVQLSGFVSSEADIGRAVAVTRGVGGVVSVKNDMRLK